MKKILLGIGMLCIAFLSHAQIMLEGVVVEKYHTDIASGRVTYRIFVDMAPNGILSSVFGDPNHGLKFTTSTQFFNSNGNNVLGNQLAEGLVSYDSYITFGAATESEIAVPLALDTDGFVDGMMFIAPEPCNIVGMTTTTAPLNIFRNVVGSSFEITNAAWYSLAGAVGATPENMVMIAQITTDGVFEYELNVSLKDAFGNIEDFFATPIGTEFSHSRLKGNSSEINVTLTSPLSNLRTGENYTISADASDIFGLTSDITQVEFFDGATSLGIVNSPPYSLSLVASSTDNTTMALTAVASTGTSTFTSNVVNILVTNPAPVVSITAPTAGTYATGTISVTANATDDGSVASVEFFAGATSLGIDNSAPFQISYNASVEGTFALTARATDNLGKSTTSAPVSITINNPAPVVSITAPTAGTYATGTISVTANATDDGSVASVEFFAGATSLGIDNSAPFQISYNATVEGTFVLTAIATDNLGKSTTSAPVSITINNPAPVVSITAPTAGTYATGTILVTANATDDGSVASVEFFVGATSLGVVNSAPFEISYNASVEGPLVFTAIATDEEGESTTSASVSITIDNPAPVVSINSPADGTEFGLNSLVTISANATDDGSVTSVEFFVGATSLGIVNSAPFQISYNASAEGSFVFTAIATDDEGKTTTSNPVTITVVFVFNPGPVVAITAPAAGTYTTSAISITADATDDGSVTSVEFFAGATSLGTDNSAPYEVTYNASVEGTFIITAIATDNLGKSTTSNPVSINVNNPAPVVTITSPTAGTYTTGAIVITADATDDGSIASVEFFAGATSLGVDNSFPYEVTYNATTEGSFVITAIAIDEEGKSTTSGSVTITVTNPAPVVTITSPTAGTYTTGAIVITADATDDGSIASVEFFAGATSLGTVNTAPYEVTYNATTEGPFVITAIAIDEEGKSTTSGSVTITVTNPAPVVTITSPTAGTYTTGSISITASATDDGTVTNVEFFAGATSLGTDNSAPYEVTYNASTEGTFVLTAVAIDEEGKSTTSASVSIVVGNPAPVVSITAPAAGAVSTGTITITVSATDDGSVASVQYFANGVSLGTVAVAPFSFTYNASVEGTFVLTAVATDDEGSMITSSPVSITVSNPAPVVSITAPTAGTYATGAITVSANATDDGTVTSVEFFAGATLLGTDNSAPFQVTYNASTEGTFVLTAVASDEEGKTTTSAPVSIVIGNPAPVVSITAPVAGTEFAIGDVVTITASATDNGTVASVVFRVGSTIIGTVTAAPYSISYTITDIGIKNLTAIATDNDGKSSISAIISVSVPSATSYELAIDTLACNTSDIFMVPVVRTNVLANCTGFNIELSYDKSKVQPTGEISINNDLINRLYVTTTTDIKNGKIDINISLNGAGGLTTFNGMGQVVAVEFAKTANFRAVDTVLFAATLLESYLLYAQPVAVANGILRTYRDSDFTGMLQFWADNSPIVYDIANPSSHLITNITASGVTVQPNVTGSFSVINTNDSISISRNVDQNTDVMPVVNGYDAYLTAVVAVKDVRFVPNIYQILAMDVNMDGIISAGDVSQINQRTAKIREEFVQVGGAGKDWLFVDADAIADEAQFQISKVYPNPDGIGYSMYMVPSVDQVMSLATELEGCAVTAKTYVGIMIGDADGNYKKLTPTNTADYALLKSELVDVASNGKVTFDMAKAVINGNFIDVPVSISSDLAIYSLDFALQYNETALQFAEVISNDKNLKVVSYYNTNDKTLRLTSYKMDELAMRSTIITIRFAVVSSVEEVVVADVTSIKAYLNGELVTSEVTTLNDGEILNPSTLEAAVYPNPVVDVLLVIVSQESTIEVLNVVSQPIYVIEHAISNTVYSIDVRGYAKGTYFVKVSNGTDEVVTPVIKK